MLELLSIVGLHPLMRYTILLICTFDLCKYFNRSSYLCFIHHVTAQYCNCLPESSAHIMHNKVTITFDMDLFFYSNITVQRLKISLTRRIIADENGMHVNCTLIFSILTIGLF